MWENLETLIELHKQGTMKQTAASLRISQSAVSKRIAAIESHNGIKLIEKVGRKVKLNPHAIQLINKAKPILSELKDILKSPSNQVEKPQLSFGVSESILSSWGALTFERIFQPMGLEVMYHSHRSPLVIEKVESGVFDLGLCSGKIKSSRSVISEEIQPEELILVAQTAAALKNKSKKLLVIENTSSTWTSIKSNIHAKDLKASKEVESFFSICQLARAGHGVGLVPRGVANTLKVPVNCQKSFHPKLYRPIQIVYKKSFLERDYFQKLVSELKKIKVQKL